MSEVKRTPTFMTHPQLNRIFSYQAFGDNQPLQFIRSAADYEQRRVAVITLDVQVFGVARAAVNAHRLPGHLLRGLGGEELRHSDLQVAAFSPIFLLGGRICQQPRRFDFYAHLGQHDLDRLVLADRLVERVSLLRVPDRVFEGRARQSDAARRHVDALALQPRHDLFETLVFTPADQVLRRDVEVVEIEFAGLDAAISELIDVADDFEAAAVVRALLDDERGDAFVRRVGFRVSLGRERERVAVSPVSDPHLRAVDQIAALHAGRHGADALHVGAGVGFGERQPAASFSAGQPREVFTLLLFGPEAVDDVAGHRMGADRPDHAHPPARQLFDDHRESGVTQAQSAVFFWHVAAEEPHIFHLLDDLVRVFVAALKLPGRGNDLPFDELPDAGDDLLLNFVGSKH